jgi:hypothetical protein
LPSKVVGEDERTDHAGVGPAGRRTGRDASVLVGWQLLLQDMTSGASRLNHWTLEASAT